MVLTSDVSLIARAAKKSLENPNIHSRIRGAVKEILNCIEYCPLYPKSETKNDFDILISLKRSAKTPEEKELIEKAWRIVRRAEVNAQIRELEGSMEPEEVDLEDEEEEKEEVAEEKQDSDSLSKHTDLNQELTAVRKDFEKYKATNDAKLDALEQKVAQMALGSGVQAPESSDIVSEAGKSSGSTTVPKRLIKVRVERLGPLVFGADQALGSTTQPKTVSGSAAKPTQAQEALNNKPKGPTPQTQDLVSQQMEQLQRIQQLQSKVVQNTIPINPLEFSGPAKASSGLSAEPKGPTPQQLQQFQQLQYEAQQNPQMMLNGFCMPYFYGPMAFSGLTAEPNLQQLQQILQQQYMALQTSQLINQLGGIGLSYFGPETGVPSGLSNGPTAASGLTTEPKETSGSTSSPEMFPALLKQAQKAFSGLTTEPKASSGSTASLTQAPKVSGLANGPKAFSGLATEPKKSSGSTARPEMFPALLKAPKASDPAAELEGFGTVAQDHSDSTVKLKTSSGLTTQPKGFSGSTTKPQAPSSSTAKPESFPDFLFQAQRPTPQQLQQLHPSQHYLLKNPPMINQLTMLAVNDDDDDGW
ncbi:unnamed protein product [Caenorhabditis brenneri]